MSNIEKIRQEIERLKIDYLNRSYTFVPATMEQLLEFIDSLPEEKPSEDLEEAAENYIAPIENDEGLYYFNFAWRDIRDAFIAGAEWQKEQMELDGVVTLTESDFDAEKEKASGWGYNLCKEQMMNRAVDGEIGYWNQTGLSIRLDQSLEKLGYDEDTEVKIIIVKQDDRPRD